MMTLKKIHSTTVIAVTDTATSFRTAFPTTPDYSRRTRASLVFNGDHTENVYFGSEDKTKYYLVKTGTAREFAACDVEGLIAEGQLFIWCTPATTTDCTVTVGLVEEEFSP